MSAEQRAKLTERKRGLRTEAVRQMQAEAKARHFKTPLPENDLLPPAGTLGWLRRQGNALVQMLGEMGCAVTTILCAVIMANASNELGETRIGQRRIVAISGGRLSLRTVGNAWVELRRVQFFQAEASLKNGEVPVKDFYKKKRRAGTYHALAMPRDEQLSMVYAPLPLEPDRQQSLPLASAPAEPDEQEPLTAPRAPAGPPHTGGETCPCRPCRAAAEACPEVAPQPSVADSAWEASLTEDSSLTEDVGVVEGVTSARPMLPLNAATAAINAAPEPEPAIAFELTPRELADARAIQRRNDTQAWNRNAPRKEPASITVTAFAKSRTSTVVNGKLVRGFDERTLLLGFGYRADSIRTSGSGAETGPPDGPTTRRAANQALFKSGHRESCDCDECERSEHTKRDDRPRGSR